jgi:hypothetical protein
MTGKKRVVWTGVIVYFVLVAGGLGALIWAASPRRASGHVVTERRPVKAFDRVHVSGMGTLVIVQGQQESLTVEAQDDILPQIETTVRHGELLISLGGKWPRDLMPTKPITYSLTVKQLSAISTSGAVAVEGRGNLRASDLTIDTSGSGTVDLHVTAKSVSTAISGSGAVDLGVTARSVATTISGSGVCSLRGAAESHSAQINGSGQYLARALTSSQCKISINGSGSAQVAATEALEAQVSGSGDVSYWGDPKVHEAVAGSGSVHRGEA